MKRLLFSAINLAFAFGGLEAQTTPPSRYAGEWKIAFTTESRTGEPNLKPSPWLAFTATVVQVDSALGGAMRSDGPTGQFGCKLRGDACVEGRMRLSWDAQDWQLFEVSFDGGSTARGAAEIRFPDGSVHRYTFAMTRP